jgi:hypothetical protein
LARNVPTDPIEPLACPLQPGQVRAARAGPVPRPPPVTKHNFGTLNSSAAWQWTAPAVLFRLMPMLWQSSRNALNAINLRLAARLQVTITMLNLKGQSTVRVCTSKKLAMPVNGMMTMKAMQFPSNYPKGSPILILLLMKMMKNIWLVKNLSENLLNCLNLRRTRNPGNVFSSLLKVNLSSD